MYCFTRTLRIQHVLHRATDVGDFTSHHEGKAVRARHANPVRILGLGLLKPLGYQVEIASSGRTGISTSFSVIEDGKVDLVEQRIGANGKPPRATAIVTLHVKRVVTIRLKIIKFYCLYSLRCLRYYALRRNQSIQTTSKISGSNRTAP